jgi:type I restriction enzyme M protein
MLPRDSIRSDLPTNSKKSELLFLAVMMQSLAPGGRCAVVIPEGLLFGSTAAHTELRKKLCTDFEVQCVVSLSAGVFKPYAGVKTSILIFRRPVAGVADHGTHAQRRVWFYDLALDGYDADKISGGGRPQTPEKNDIPAFLAAWSEFRRDGGKTPPGVAAGTLLPAGTPEPKSWHATLEQIEAADWTLSASRYKPQTATAVSNENPVQLTNDIIKIEKSIVLSLEALNIELKATR